MNIGMLADSGGTVVHFTESVGNGDLERSRRNHSYHGDHLNLISHILKRLW